MFRWPQRPPSYFRIVHGYQARSLYRQKRSYESNAFVTPKSLQPTRPVPTEVPEDPPGTLNTTPLRGRHIAIKDNICTKDFPTTCASNILADFKSPYNATVVELLQKAGAVITGKTNMDEFGMGSHNTQSRFGAVQNYAEAQAVDEALSAGGSSGGSAMAVKEGQVWTALGTDTGGSVRLPAAYTGVFGFKPSYGLISRHGVVAYANSLDTVGILSRSLDAVKLSFEILNRFDSNDPTSLSENTRSRVAQVTNRRSLKSSETTPNTGNVRKRRYRIGVPKEYNIQELTPTVRSAWKSTLALLRSDEYSIHNISLPTTKQALSAYYVLAPAEACSNLAKYDGIRYGRRTAAALDDEAGYLFGKSRGESFGKEVQRRILLGTYSLSAAAMDNYFIQAQRVRRLVQQDFDAVFRLPNPLHTESENAAAQGDQVDIIVVPTAPSLPPTLSSLKNTSPLDMYTNDVFTVPASLAGLPAVSLPCPAEITEVGNPRMPAGIQLIGQFGDDSLVLEAAGEIHEKIQNASV